MPCRILLSYRAASVVPPLSVVFPSTRFHLLQLSRGLAVAEIHRQPPAEGRLCALGVHVMAELLGQVFRLISERPIACHASGERQRTRGIAPNDVQMWMNEPGNTRHFIRGVMHRGLQLAGAPNVQVEILSTDDAGTVFRFTW